MYIKGVGCTKFGSQSDNSQKLAYDAAFEALEDGETRMSEIDAVVISTGDTPTNGERQRLFASIMSSMFHVKIPIITASAVCAGGGTCIWTANQLNYNNIMVIGVERLLSNNTTKVTDDIMMAAERLYEQTEGLNFPAQNALVAQQHMLKYGTTTDDFALVSYKNHKNAFLNPKARFYKKEVTIKKIKKSPIVASPLRLFDCSVSANGAAAAILTRDKTDIKIIGSGFCVDRLSAFESQDMTSWPATKLAAEQAFKQAGITPQDIDAAEIHDAFTSVEIMSYEDLDFCKQGEGSVLIRDNITAIDGKLPVNTSGGLKAKGHPISATGIGQIYELAKQLRGIAGDRQVSAKYALAQNIGGAGSTVSVHILKKISG